MAKQFYSLLTTYGEQVLAQAVANRRPLHISQMAVGDGNGKATLPTSQLNALVREVHRANISAVSLDPRNNKQVIFELTIPENIGGFYIREMGIFDDQHKLVAYANCPESFKPTLESGSGKVQVLRMILKVSSSDAVTLSVDHSVIFVTKAQFTPQTLTATTQNAVSEQGHSHEIAKGNTSQAGLVRLTNNTWLDSEELGLSAKGAKKLAQEISQNRINVTKSLNEKVDKTAVSDAVNSDSQTNVASSRAAKTAYDKAVDGVNRANNAQNTANDAVNRANNAQTKANQADNNANGRIPLSGDCEITGVKSFFGQLRIRSSGDLTKYARFGQNNNDTFIQNPYSGKYFQIRNDGSLRYDGNLIFVKGFQNPSWKDVENKPNLVEQSGSYAVLKPKDSGYAGMSIERTGNAGSWASRIEALPDKRWKFWVQNSHDIYLPVKSGTVALVEDLNEKFNHSVTDVRLGAETSRILGDPEWRSHGAGYVVTGFFNKTGDFNGNDVVWLRPIQKQIRGQWITVANA